MTDRRDKILAKAKELCLKADDRCARFRDIRDALPGRWTFEEIEDALEDHDHFETNVAIRVDHKVYELAKGDWMAEWLGDE